MLSTVLRENFGDNGYDFGAHETDSELQDRLVRSVWCRGHETSGFQCSSECLCAESAQASLYRYPLRFSFRGRRQWAQPSKSMESWILEASDERSSDRLALFVSDPE